MASLQNIGIMMTCNEGDIIEEVMKENTKYFDKIFVLDGSTDKTPEIIRSFDAVKYFITDKDLNYPGRVTDGARQFLIDKAQEMYGAEGWFTLLHGDEIFYDNPIKIAEMAEKAGAEKVNWQPHNFFLHTSDMNKDFSAIKSVQDRVTWYSPAECVEIRQYRNKPGIQYDIYRYNWILPKGIGLKTILYFPNYKHYVYRSAEMMMKRYEEGLKRGFFGQTHREPLTFEKCFREKLNRINRKWDGSFHEFEMDQQMKPWNLLKRTLLRSIVY
jgi:glycosyltransferase involved in cell wall biosynthesis